MNITVLRIKIMWDLEPGVVIMSGNNEGNDLGNLTYSIVSEYNNAF